MKFKVGDQVSVLDDDLQGIIMKIDSDRITVLTSDGFEMDFSTSELIKIEGELNLKQNMFSNTTAYDIISKKEQSKKKKSTSVKPKKRSQPVMEVDLHIHKLTDSTKGMTNYDMLTLQLDTARQQLEFAMRKRVQRVVFIHGVGEGVLKMELETLFRRYDNLKFYDANLKKYGFGATEIYIYQNTTP
jgi:dsDNA-specific endonuclease/ATPase MutS2